MNITNSVKKTKAGIAYTVFQDGVEIGSRCTKRASGFKFAAVARKNHVRCLAQAREGQEWKEATGRAVMRGPYGWALNMGGRYGTPGVATPENIVRVGRAK